MSARAAFSVSGAPLHRHARSAAGDGKSHLREVSGQEADKTVADNDKSVSGLARYLLNVLVVSHVCKEMEWMDSRSRTLT